MSRLRLTLIVVAIAALVAPGSGLARFDADSAASVAKTVRITLPDVGDVTIARITYTAATRQAKNPKLSVANAAALPESVSVLGSIRALNGKRRTFEALVLVVSPARGDTLGRLARPSDGDAPVVLRASANGKLKAKLEEAFDLFGSGIAEFVCEDVAFAAAIGIVIRGDIPDDIDVASFGQKLCSEDPGVVGFVRGPLPADGAVGVDHIGPGISYSLGSFRTAAGALVHATSSAGGQWTYRALRLFTEDDFESDPLSQACFADPISTFGTKAFTWNSSLYGQTASVTESLNVNATEVPIPGCVTSGDVTSVEAWGCFGPAGRGYIGKTIKGTPGTRFSVELTSPVSGMFYGTSTALVTGTIPADGEVYTGTPVESRGLINVKLFDGGSSSVTMTVDTSEDLEPAPEEAEPVCDVM
jgi:hypothetical protein